MGYVADDTLTDWDFSCVDWKDRLKTGSSLMPVLPLDPVQVARAVGIFNKLKLPDVAGTPALREAAGDWQRELVGAVMGSVDDTGLRRVRQPFVLVPKKNSKTTGAAALMLTAVLMDDEPNQFYGLYGPTQEIADRGYAQAKGMIEADEVLAKRFHIQDHKKTITDRVTGTSLKVTTFDEKVAAGTIPKGILIDELHVLGKVHYAGRVMTQLRGGLQARPGGFMVTITTQSDEPPAGVFKAELQLARAIRDGKVRGEAASVLPLLYEFPEEMQRDELQPWRNPDCWHQVLPNLGRSLRLDMLRADCATEEAKGEVEARVWYSQHLNIEIGLALHSNRWIGADYWQAAGDPDLTLDAMIERSEVIVAGIDGGGLDDLLGLALIGRDRVTKQWLHWAHAWAHDDVWKQRPQIASRLEDFIAAGHLTRCASPIEDITGVGDVLERVNDAGLFPKDDAVGFDPIGVSALVDELNARGISAEQQLGIVQGYRLSGATWGLERKLKDGTFRHGAQDMMAWCVSNARVEQKGNAVVITKQAAGKSKIDPLVATLNAVSLMSRNPEAAGASVPGIHIL